MRRKHYQYNPEKVEKFIATTRQKLREGVYSRQKLTAEQVDTIKEMCGYMSNAELAEEYGVHQVTISHIRRGKSWAWL